MASLPLMTWDDWVFRHVPDVPSINVLDLRYAGRAPDNRWNESHQPTLYLASDVGVAVGEFARHFHDLRADSAGTVAL